MISPAKIREALRKKGVLPTSKEEVAKIAKKAVDKFQLQNAIPEWAMTLLRKFEPIADYEKLKWVEYYPPAWQVLLLEKRTVAWAYIQRGLILQITRNKSGNFKARHYISIHPLIDQGNVILVDPQALVGMNLECHFTYDHAKVAEFADTIMRKFIQDHAGLIKR